MKRPYSGIKDLVRLMLALTLPRLPATEIKKEEKWKDLN
jgi:hypothetical protein